MAHEAPTQFIAVRAVVVREGRALLIREAEQYAGGTQHGKYDFPGGKVKPGETLQEALIRETQEEAGIDVAAGRVFHVGEWRPVVKGRQLQIFGAFFLCTSSTGAVTLGGDHDDCQWISLKERPELPLVPEARRALSVLCQYHDQLAEFLYETEESEIAAT